MIADPPAPLISAGVEQAAHLRRVVLGSRAPRRAAAWYRRALGLPDADTLLKAGDEALKAGDVELLITYRSHVAAAAVEPIRLVLNFVVEDILEIEDRLVAMEAIWVRELERTPWGIIGTVLDLDGNLVQIIEPARGTLPWSAKAREEHS
jgi:glyoxalase/bleomycin resistance protein/dioxygenase superfamily protein